MEDDICNCEEPEVCAAHWKQNRKAWSKVRETSTNLAWFDGWYDRMVLDRIEAFAAIRRAAAVAREYDRIYREAFGIGDYDTYAYTPDGDDVRRAIRAAIKGPETND